MWWSDDDQRWKHQAKKKKSETRGELIISRKV